MRVLLLIAVIVVAFAACGERQGSASAPPPTVLRVTADQDGNGPEPPHSVRVRCTAEVKTRGCGVVRRLPRDALAPLERNAVCTQQWGGPQTARVYGRLQGRRVDVRFDRSDGCEIYRWDRAAPLLKLTGVTSAWSVPAP